MESPKLITDGTNKEKIDSVLFHIDTKKVSYLWLAWSILNALLDTNKFCWNQEGNAIYMNSTNKFTDIARLMMNLVEQYPALVRTAGYPTLYFD